MNNQIHGYDCQGLDVSVVNYQARAVVDIPIAIAKNKTAFPVVDYIFQQPFRLRVGRVIAVGPYNTVHAPVDILGRRKSPLEFTWMLPSGTY